MPLLMTCLGYAYRSMDHHSPDQTPHSSPYRWATWIALIAGLVITTTTTQLVRKNQSNMAHERFERQAVLLGTAFERRFRHALESLYALRGFYEGSSAVDRQEFRLFTKNHLERHPSILALEWIPKTPHRQRAQLTQELTNFANQSIHIKELDQNGRIKQSRSRSEYFPVQYVEPMATNKIALGFDHGSDERRLSALKQARDTGRPVACQPLTLFRIREDEQSHTGVLVYLAIYQNGLPVQTIQQRRDHLIGYVSSVVEIQTLADLALRDTEYPDLNVEVKDITPQTVSIVDQEESANRQKPMSTHWLQDNRQTELSLPLWVAERQWQLRIVSTKIKTSSWHVWGVFFAGSLYSILLAGFLRQISQQANQVRKLVIQKTAQLCQANDELQEEVAQRQSAEDALRKAQKRLDLAASGSQDGLWDWPDVRRDAQWWSPRFYELLGHNPNALEPGNTSFTNLIHRDHLNRMRRDFQYQTQIADPDDIAPLDSEFLIQLKDGSYRWFRIRGKTTRSHSGQKVRMSGSIQDIHDRKLAEEMLSKQTDDLIVIRDDLETQTIELAAKSQQLEQARHEAEQATKSKSEFLANMSHEIRTPMTAILGYTDMLLEQGDLSKAPTPRVEAIQTIQRNGQHLLAIINDILDLSKIEAGKLVIEQITCSPGAVVADVISLMRHRAQDKQLFLDVEYIGAVPETITSDPTRLRQILLNLIGNAIKFTQHGGVRLIVKMADSPDTSTRHLRFEVVDTGVGMTPEQQAKLFQAFSQADTSTTRQFGGTGLGLIISKRLSEMLGGNIAMSSKAGEGTSFCFTIETGPLDGVKMVENANETRKSQEAQASVRESAAVRLSGTILLAEDGPDNQRLITMILTKAGAQVVIAANGQIALDKALEAWKAGTPFDMILMDMQMPELDGYGATGRLREAGYTGPIVALTAHAMASDRDKCLNAGCDDYATKPINRPHLLGTLARLMTRQTHAPPEVNANPSDAKTTPPSIPAHIQRLSDSVLAIQKSLAANDINSLEHLVRQLESDAVDEGLTRVAEYAKHLRQTAKTTHDLTVLDHIVQQLVQACGVT